MKIAYSDNQIRIAHFEQTVTLEEIGRALTNLLGNPDHKHICRILLELQNTKIDIDPEKISFFFSFLESKLAVVGKRQLVTILNPEHFEDEANKEILAQLNHIVADFEHIHFVFSMQEAHEAFRTLEAA